MNENIYLQRSRRMLIVALLVILASIISTTISDMTNPLGNLVDDIYDEISIWLLVLSLPFLYLGIFNVIHSYIKHEMECRSRAWITITLLILAVFLSYILFPIIFGFGDWPWDL